MRAACLLIAIASAAPAAAQSTQPRGGKAVIPESAAEGPRELEMLPTPIKAFVTGQPYGKTWKDLVQKDPPPRDKRGIGSAESVPELSGDPIEMQQQVQFLNETGIEFRYGLVSIRALQVFRYGKLAGVQLVIDQIGREPEKRETFKSDLAAIAKAWSTPLAVFSLGAGYEVSKNDLVEQAEKQPAEFPDPPLRIQIEPVPREP